MTTNDKRLREVFQQIVNISLERYDLKGRISDNKDAYDAIITNLNILADDLAAKDQKFGRIQHIYDHQTDLIFVCKENGRILNTNLKASESLRRSPNELQLLNINTLFKNKSVLNFENKYCKLGNLELKIKGKKYLSVNCKVEKIDDQDEQKLIFFCTDTSQVNNYHYSNYNRLITEQNKKDKHVSLEINEQISQNLTALKFFLESLSKNQSNYLEIIDKLINLTDLTVNDLKKLTQKIMPTSLSSFSIVEGVNELFSAQRKLHSDISFYFNVKDLENIKLKNDVNYSIYKIVTDFVDNSIKVNNTSEISISLQRKTPSNSLRLDLFNNSNHKKNNHTNELINLLKIRIFALGGNINFLKFKKEGAEISICFPF